jgi:glycosyltransferase involved in cell wall biosynthesis
MRIFFPYKPSERIGGPTAFANAFLRNAQDLDLTADMREEVDAALFFVHIPEEAARRYDSRGIPKILRLDNIYHDPAIDYPGLNAPIFEAIDRADAVVFQSEFSRRFITHYYGKPVDKPWAVIHNGVDNRLFRPRRSTFRPDRARLLFTGAIHPQKRLHEALRLFRAWDRPGWKLLVAGGLLHYPPYLVDALQDEYGDAVLQPRPNVHFLGNQPRARLPRLMAASHICFFPSYRDSCPNAVLEALASGLPVLCERSGGIPELVGDGGVVVEGGADDLEPRPYQTAWREIARLDEARFTEAVMEIVDNYDEYRQRALDRARDLDISLTVRRYAEFFRAVLGGAAQPMEKAS